MRWLSFLAGQFLLPSNLHSRGFSASVSCHLSFFSASFLLGLLEKRGELSVTMIGGFAGGRYGISNGGWYRRDWRRAYHKNISRRCLRQVSFHDACYLPAGECVALALHPGHTRFVRREFGR